jgi:branched-chain amino acid transport system ATP-binding protein
MTPLLEASGLVKNFGALRALDEVGLTLLPGEILGVIGPNGSGKTTMFNVMTGQLKGDGGRVLLDGQDITGLQDFQICRLGLVKTAQIVQPFAGMSVLENVFIGGMYGAGLSLKQARAEALEQLEFVGLGHLAQANAGSITVAMRRRLELARALATRPKVILLDENMAGLTPSEIDQALVLLRAIHQRGVALIVVEHIMQVVVGICQRVLVLNYGQKIGEGRPEEVMRDRQVIEAYLGEHYA